MFLRSLGLVAIFSAAGVLISSCGHNDGSGVKERHAALEKDLQERQSKLEQEVRQRQENMEKELESLKKEIQSLSAKFEHHGHPFHLVLSPRLIQSKPENWLIQGNNPWYITDRPIDEERLKKKWERVVDKRAIINLGPGWDYSNYDESRD